MWQGVLMPYEVKRLVCEPTAHIDLAICIDGISSSKGGIYNLNLLARYTIKDISDDAEFFITREKIRVSVDVSYERVFVETKKASIVFEKIEAQNARQLQKRYKRNHFIELLYMPLIMSPMTTIAFLFLGLLVGWLISWRTLLFYYPAMYLCFFLAYFIGHSFVGFVSKKAFRFDNTITFHQFLDPSYITWYYAQPNREPFLGKVDRK
jgi:hypothetical protein